MKSMKLQEVLWINFNYITKTFYKSKNCDQINPHYVKEIKKLSKDIRYVLVDFLYKKCKSAKLRRETFMMSIYLMDVYFSKINIFEINEI